MARTLNRALLAQIVGTYAQDTAGRLSSVMLDDCIASALDEFSRRRPRRVAPVAGSCPTGNGTNRVSLSGISTFVPGFSTVLGLEYPVDQAPPETIDARYWTVDPELLVLITNGVTIADGERFRLRHTSPHTVANFPDSGGSTTVSAPDFEVLGILAAAYACDALAGLYANTVDPTFGADVVNNRTKSGEYEARARALRARFEQRMSPPAEAQPPASSFGSWDTYATDGLPYVGAEPASIV